MRIKRSRGSSRNAFMSSLVAAVILICLSASPVSAHCDGLDGPVVTAAQTALKTGNLNHVLIWVRPEDATQIKAAFDEALVVRKLSPQAENLADRSFFETLVRVHRAAEGAPFTGLKPAGRDLGPAIPAADNAIKTGKDDDLKRLLIKEVQEGVATRFQHLQEKKNFAVDNVTAGRDYEKSSNGHYEELE